MAESERDNNRSSSTDFNSFLMDIDVVVANILIELISENTIFTTRQTLFENLIERYMEKVKNAGIEVESATTLSIKMRQGVNATVSSYKTYTTCLLSTWDFSNVFRVIYLPGPVIL